MKRLFLCGALVVSAAVIVATATASKPGTTRSQVFQASNNGLLAANGAQVVLSGTLICSADATTFTIQLNVTQGSTISLPPVAGNFNCVAGAPAAWTLIVNASTGTYKTGQASAHLTASDNGSFPTNLTGDTQVSLSSSVQGVEVPVAGP